MKLDSPSCGQALASGLQLLAISTSPLLSRDSQMATSPTQIDSAMKPIHDPGKSHCRFRRSSWLLVGSVLLLVLAARGPAFGMPEDSAAASAPVVESSQLAAKSNHDEEPQWRRTTQGWVRAAEMQADVALEQAQQKQSHAPHPLIIAGLLVFGTLFTLIAFSKDADWK